MHPLVYALTGGIACGKSTLAGLLRGRGWTVVDSDEIAHRLMAPSGENWQKVIDGFGLSILNADQTINRVVLGDMIFREPSLRDRLNSLTHPAIRKAWRAELEGFLEKIAAGRLDRKRDRLVVVIPLLFEAGLEDDFETVMCVGCSPALQQARLAGRGLDAGRIAHRLASQLPLEEKIRRSHHLFWNEGTLAALARQIERLPEPRSE